MLLIFTLGSNLVLIYQDGEDNTYVESRWSCAEALEVTDTACYITFEMEEDVAVESVTICEWRISQRRYSDLWGMCAVVHRSILEIQAESAPIFFPSKSCTTPKRNFRFPTNEYVTMFVLFMARAGNQACYHVCCLNIRCRYTLFVLFPPNKTEMISGFRESDDATRPTNSFIISTAVDGDSGVFTQQLEGVNKAGTPLGVGEQFDLPAPATARFVRIEAVLAPDQWISLHEVYQHDFFSVGFIVHVFDLTLSFVC